MQKNRAPLLLFLRWLGFFVLVFHIFSPNFFFRLPVAVPQPLQYWHGRCRCHWHRVYCRCCCCRFCCFWILFANLWHVIAHLYANALFRWTKYSAWWKRIFHDRKKCCVSISLRLHYTWFSVQLCKCMIDERTEYNGKNESWTKAIKYECKIRERMNKWAKQQQPKNNKWNQFFFLLPWICFQFEQLQRDKTISVMSLLHIFLLLIFLHIFYSKLKKKSTKWKQTTNKWHPYAIIKIKISISFIKHKVHRRGKENASASGWFQINLTAHNSTATPHRQTFIDFWKFTKKSNSQKWRKEDRTKLSTKSC